MIQMQVDIKRFITVIGLCDYESKEPHNLPCARQRLRKADGVDQYKSEAPENQGRAEGRSASQLKKEQIHPSSCFCSIQTPRNTLKNTPRNNLLPATFSQVDVKLTIALLRVLSINVMTKQLTIKFQQSRKQKFILKKYSHV